MKQFFTLFFTLSFFIAQAQVAITDTVSMGAGYAQQVWYSLGTDTETKSPRLNWDLAFSCRSLDAAILANPNVKMYRPRAAANAWATAVIDTTVFTDSDLLYNSDTSWAWGAMNVTANYSNAFDYGWGNYNIVTHNLTADSFFVMKNNAGEWKKIIIDRLVRDTMYFVRIANLDGSGLDSFTVLKKNYNTKNFVYYNTTTRTRIDREPVAANWDLTFTQYWSYVPTSPTILQPYILTGVLHNLNTRVAKTLRRDTANNNFSGLAFRPEISTIGADWKTFAQQTNRWILSDTNSYFVRTASGAVWKLVFTGFGGSANGNFIFRRTLIQTSNVQDVKAGNATFAVYPNPARNHNIHLIYDLGENGAKNAEVQIFDMAGRVVFRQNLPTTEGGLFDWQLPNIGLNVGMYFVRLQYDNKQTTQKLIISDF